MYNSEEIHRWIKDLNLTADERNTLLRAYRTISRGEDKLMPPLIARFRTVMDREVANAIERLKNAAIKSVEMSTVIKELSDLNAFQRYILKY